MREASLATPAKANSGAAENCGKDRNELRWIRNVLRVIREVSPRKPRMAFQEWTGLSLRQCDYILAEKSGMSADTYRDLLDTPFGFEVLTASFGDAPPPWLAELVYLRRSARLSEQIREARAEQNALRKKVR
jgi:hypothetical protein